MLALRYDIYIYMSLGFKRLNSVHCQGDLYVLIRHFQTQGLDPNLGCGSFLMTHELPE